MNELFVLAHLHLTGLATFTQNDQTGVLAFSTEADAEQFLVYNHLDKQFGVSSAELYYLVNQSIVLADGDTLII